MPSELLDTKAAAEWLGLQPGTLKRRRVEGTGPVFLTLGGGSNGPVRYRISDLEKWCVERRSTSERGHEPVTA